MTPSLKKVLVVEDERSLAEAVRIKLEKSGFSATTASTAKAALDQMSTNTPDAVWLDHYLLGQEDGLDFVASVKKEEAWKNIPIFVVSNTASPEKISTYIALGVNRYYTKSNFRLEDIIADISRTLGDK